MNWMYASAMVWVSMFAVQAHASIADCDAALIVSTYNNIETSKSDWRMASHVDQGAYEKIRTEVGATGAIYGVPVGANYGQFKENIKTFTTTKTEAYNKEQFRNVSWTGLGPDAGDAYKECIRAQKKGLAIVPDKATESDLTFRVLYSVVGGSPNPLPVYWGGAAANGARLPDAISAGEVIIVLDRPSQTSTLALNSADKSGLADSIVITPVPEPISEELKFENGCIISETPSPGAIVAGQNFAWICERVQAGTYSVDLSVKPETDRPVRMAWRAELQLDSNSDAETIPLNTSSGVNIDAGIDAGIGTSFESHNNIVKVKEAGSLPIVRIHIDSTFWHEDYSKQSNDPIKIPVKVSIVMKQH